MKKIEPGIIVELKYTLREEGVHGEVLEVMDEHWPLKFYFGAGSMLPAFESALKGLHEGAHFSFGLPAEEAYGLIDPGKIEEIAFKDLPHSEQFPNKAFVIGDRLVFNMGARGEQLGTVSEVLPQSILVDFNHALAGKKLHFTGQVLYIRKARKEEEEARRYIEPNGIRSNSKLSDGPDF